MPVRLKDIARDLGVSVVTVSKVLRNRSDIGEETRQRVLKRIKELNYHPNFAARALVTRRTYTVGLVVPDLVHPFFAQVTKALSATLRRSGYGLLLASSEEDPALETEEIEQFLSRSLDAIVIASTQWTVESFRRIEEQKIPYVLIDRRFMGFPGNFVGIDDEAVGALATEHLIAAGCRRIAHIRGSEGTSTGMGRLAGYKQALARHGMESPPGYIVAGKTFNVNSESSGAECMKQLLRRDPRPDAVFCYNDPAAIGAMNVILNAGLAIPEDIALIGCGNLHYDPSLRVPLSSIDQQSELIGTRAAKLALTLIEPPSGLQRPRTILLKPTLVIRASSARNGGRRPLPAAVDAAASTAREFNT